MDLYCLWETQAQCQPKVVELPTQIEKVAPISPLNGEDAEQIKNLHNSFEPNQEKSVAQEASLPKVG